MKKFERLSKFLSVTLVLLIISVSFISCGGASKSGDNFFRDDTLYSDTTSKKYEYNGISPSYGGDYNYDESEIASENKTSASSPLEGRKIIKTVNVSAETKEFDDACRQIATLVTELGGYVQSSNSYGRSYYYASNASRSASYTLRIPADRLSEFMDATSGAVNIISQTENVDDITETYVDTEARLNALRLEEERLLALLEKGDNLSDIITVEERLSDVRYQIESYTARIRGYDTLIAYSTVNIEISEVIEYTPAKTASFGDRISKAFRESWADFADGCRNFAVNAVYAFPTILVLIVIAAVIVLIVLIIKKNCKKKKEKRIAEFMARQNQGSQNS